MQWWKIFVRDLLNIEWMAFFSFEIPIYLNKMQLNAFQTLKSIEIKGFFFLIQIYIYLFIHITFYWLYMNKFVHMGASLIELQLIKGRVRTLAKKNSVNNCKTFVFRKWFPYIFLFEAEFQFFQSSNFFFSYNEAHKSMQQTRNNT